MKAPTEPVASVMKTDVGRDRDEATLSNANEGSRQPFLMTGMLSQDVTEDDEVVGSMLPEEQVDPSSSSSERKNSLRALRLMY
jgi:hypothetical protein